MLLTSSTAVKHLTTMKTMSRTLFIFLAYFTCCISAWPAPAPAYRRTFNNANNYMPYSSNNVAYEPEYQLPQESYNYNSQWDRAREPMSYYDLFDDYWMNQQAPVSDVDALSNLGDLYDPPVWGQIVNGKPETELEELKAEERQREAEDRQRALEDQYKYYAYDYSGHQEKRNPAPKAPAEHQAANGPSTPATATTSASASATVTSKHTPEATTSSPKAVRVQSGQKEVPLLRPPMKAKLIHDQEAGEPVIAVAQRSVEKPSAYDTLRKYLSLEDALKKEAEKRRVPGGRHQKRSSAGNKQIVTDADSLTGQLHNLKKSMN